MWTWLAVACATSSPAEVERRNAHYDDWPLLARAVRAGDLDGARRWARDLAASDPGGPPALGAALGALQVAEDAEELQEGLAAAARACAACHRDRGVAWNPESP